jgi:hypothetical protein
MQLRLRTTWRTQSPEKTSEYKLASKFSTPKETPEQAAERELERQQAEAKKAFNLI